MEHRNSVWMQLFEQLIVIFATITLFCLLPDFSDGNHSVAQQNKSENIEKIQTESINQYKKSNKHSKKKNKSVVAHQDNRHSSADEELLDELLDFPEEENKDLTPEEPTSEQAIILEQTTKELSTVLATEELNRVEKINAEIEEQTFMFTIQQEQDKLTDEVLNKISSNLVAIKKMAEQEGINNLIDTPSISELDKKIALYRKNIL